MTVSVLAADDPLVSVVIIAHNCAEFVATAINSVRGQTWEVLEIIVIDDGSTDNSAAVVESIIDPRLQCIRTENRGPSAARNEGIRRARGEFIAFLDCDDQWAPRKLESQMVVMLQRPDIGLVYSLAIRVDAMGRELTRFGVVEQGRLLDRLLRGNCIAGSASSALVRRSFVDRIGLFDESLQRAEDWEYWIRLASVCEIACVPDYDVILLDRPGSHGKHAAKTRDDSLRFMRRVLDRYASGRWWFRRTVLAELHYVANFNFWEEGSRWRARKELLWSLSYNPFYLTYYKRLIRLFFPKRPPLTPSSRVDP